MNKNIQSQVYKILYQVLADAKTEVDIELIMKALMSEAEVMAIAKRLAIAVFLDKGQSYEHIRETLKVSSATIANVAEGMNKGCVEYPIVEGVGKIDEIGLVY
ncbi:MAG: hypothetical protein UX38_C0030G0002 [Microgenomates group bacterium GW2011_GWC1_46_16]|nr:MAG: hypothetical protein UX38_C0030G0002 [Microgenomates group bacterium GW2011_GWC1_46_16]